MRDKEVLGLFICIGLFSSALGNPFKWKSLFDDDEPMTTPDWSELNRGLERIIGWLDGKDKLTGESKKFDFAFDSEKKEIVAKNLKEISIHCEAPFPVTLTHEGDPEFKFKSTGSGSSMAMYANGTHEMEVDKFSMFASLPSDCSHCTGKFICKWTGESTGLDHDKKHETVSAHISFSTENIFVLSRTATISSDDIPFIFPCSVGEPNATVTLVKFLPDQNTIRPVQFEKYDPKHGFTLTKSEENSEGIFYCIASYENFHRALEFSVIQGKVNCTKRCNENSQCTVDSDMNQVCMCKPGYLKYLVSEKCLKPCRTDGNCDEGMACIPQETGSFLLDILAYPEGKMDSEDDDHHEKRGKCVNPCVYTKSKCGNNEECRVVDHKPVCGSEK